MAWAHGKTATAAGLVLAAGLTLVSACTVGPDYQRPTVAVPASFKEQDGWKPGTPRDAADRGAWWSIYRDALLDQLERRVIIDNQSLKASEAAYLEAAAVVRAGQAGFYPTVTTTPSMTHVSRGGSGGSGGGGGGGGGGGSAGTSGAGAGSGGGASSYNQYALAGALSWEVDVWGRIRRTVEADVANAQASAGDLASARLSAQALLATDYFELRNQDELKRLLDAAVVAYTESLRITRNQYKAGVAARSDVAQAETQLEATQAQAVNVGVLRAQLEHAIAVLTGQPPSSFSIPPAQVTMIVPAIPVTVPSTLLERRPDIAAAERRVANANAEIGVAIAAYYPAITLSASLDFTSTAISTLLQAANRVWSVGPQLAETLFDGGLRDAQVEEARAAYDQAAATYRQTVLTGFQQVEDQLTALGVLARQADIQAEAVKSAQNAERLILNQYKAGTVAYTSVVTAQTAALSDEQTALTIFQNRLTASVALVQALGGGWDASQLPTDDRIDSDRREATANTGEAGKTGGVAAPTRTVTALDPHT
jgi:NodT family efflux transporter outer membrane factor (OMF) lipoprotein